MLNKILNLERPLASLDCETTGLKSDVDRIIQLSITMHYKDKDPISWKSFINPETPILNDQHGIKDEDVKDSPTFKDIADQIAKYLLMSDICGYNVLFDIGFIKAEMKRANIPFEWNNHIVDGLQLYKLKRGHTLSNFYLEFGGENGEPLPSDTDLSNAHEADFDVMMTDTGIRGILLRFKNLPRTVAALSGFCFPHPENAVDKTGKFVWSDGDAAFNFGKHRGKLLKNTPEYYLKWMVNGEFPDDVKKICSDALDGIYPEKK